MLLDWVSIFVNHSRSTLIWLTVASSHDRCSMSNSLIGVLAGHTSRRTTVTHVAVVLADLVLILHHYATMTVLVLPFIGIFGLHWG